MAEEGVPFKRIAEALASELSLPAVSKTIDDTKQFGFLSSFVAVDNPVSSRRTQESLGWRPTQPDVLTDLPHSYFGRKGARAFVPNGKARA